MGIVKLQPGQNIVDLALASYGSVDRLASWFVNASEGELWGANRLTSEWPLAAAPTTTIIERDNLFQLNQRQWLIATGDIDAVPISPNPLPLGIGFDTIESTLTVY